MTDELRRFPEIPPEPAPAASAPARRSSSSTLTALSLGLFVALASNSAYTFAPTTTAAPAITAEAGTAACGSKALTKSAIQGLKVYSFDGAKYLVNKEDDGGIAQIYISTTGGAELTCLTCVELPGGPTADRFKMQPHWHPSGKWIFMAVERATYTAPEFAEWIPGYVEGQLQNGIWTNMYAVSSDGLDWHQMTDFTGAPGTPDGFSGVAFTPDGKKAVWSQIVDGNILFYWPFGRWELTMADFAELNGVPRLTNLKNITPPGMNWNEPGNFAPDNESLVFAGSTEKDAQGMDEYVLNIKTTKLVNLTNSPTVWDEHGQFSPGGDKIIFMSAYPYRDNPKASKVLSIKTEFMLMNSDGSELTQLTHFLQPGYPEYSPFNSGIAANPRWHPTGRSASLRRLLFPNYEDWDVEFMGVCGSRLAAPTGLRVKSD